MAQNDVAKAWETFDEWTLAALQKAKAKWIHECFRALLPPDIYALASTEQELSRCSAWAKDQGYHWRGFRGEDRLMKGPLTVAVFRPFLTGKGDDRHVEIHAEVLGIPVTVTDDAPTPIPTKVIQAALAAN